MVEYWDLLQNVLACWSPAAGVTGNILIDRSPNKIHASLSSYQTDSWRFGSFRNETFNALNFASPGIAFATASRGDALSNQLTVSAWIRYTGTWYQDDIIRVGSGGHYYLWLDRGNLRLDSPGQYGASNIVITIGYGLATTTWENILFTVNNNNAILYRNGNQIGSGTLAALSGNTNVFRLFDYAFTGLMSEVAIWNKTLNSSQVARYVRLGPQGIGRYLANPRLPRVPYVAQVFNSSWARGSNVIVSPVGAA